MAIECTTIGSTAAQTSTQVWSETVRTLSAATNITSNGGTIDQTKIANLDTTVSSRATPAQVATALNGTTTATVNTLMTGAGNVILTVDTTATGVLHDYVLDIFLPAGAGVNYTIYIQRWVAGGYISTIPIDATVLAQTRSYSISKTDYLLVAVQQMAIGAGWQTVNHRLVTGV